MRVAVTGATGFVGSHVIRRLTASGHQVRILARRMPITALTPDKPLEVVLGDLDDQAALHRLVGGVDAVIHVAGIIKARHAADQTVQRSMSKAPAMSRRRSPKSRRISA
jgi:uncharacterized protein YbjT (DUF2867 family)